MVRNFTIIIAIPLPLQSLLQPVACVYAHICMYLYIYGAYIDGSSIQPWHPWCTEMQLLCPDIQKSTIPESKKSKLQRNIQNSKIQKIQHPKTMNKSRFSVEFWIFGILDFWVSVFSIFGVWDFGKFGFLDLWLRGYLGTKRCISACRGGGGIYVISTWQPSLATPQECGRTARRRPPTHCVMGWRTGLRFRI